MSAQPPPHAAIATHSPITRFFGGNEMRILLLAAFTLASVPATAQLASDSTKREIGQFLAHPLFATPYTCEEHAAGELKYLGDDLGQDCVPMKFVDTDGVAFMRSFKADGLRNEDWFGWQQPVLSPCDCKVVAVRVNPITNSPGHPGKPPASSIKLEAANGTNLVLAHVDSASVSVGDAVHAGQPIARVGNNGFARMPHIHIGA